MTAYRISALAACAALLAGCMAPENKVTISPQAEAALPPGTDIRNVRRLANGCYFIVKDMGVGATTQPLVNAYGEPVCDPEPLENMLSPNRVVVNEAAS